MDNAEILEELVRIYLKGTMFGERAVTDCTSWRLMKWKETYAVYT